MIHISSITQKISLALSGVTDHVIRERLLIVKASFKKPLREVASEFVCTHGKVAYWKNRYLKLGLRGLYTKERSGRPSKLEPKLEAKIRIKVRRHNPKHGWTTKLVREYVKNKSRISYSERQTQRLSHKWGLTQIKPRKRSAYSKKEDREAFLKKTKNS